MTPKQQRFVDEYLIDLNATQAAIRAGYSAKTAGQIGEENLRKPEIAAAVSEAKAKRAQETAVDAAWVLKRLAEEAVADLGDLMAEDGSLKPIHEWPLIWRQGLVAGIEVEDLFEGRGEDREKIGRVHKVKLSDRIKRIELIGKHVGVQAFKDRLEVDVSEDLAAVLSKARERALGIGG